MNLNDLYCLTVKFHKSIVMFSIFWWNDNDFRFFFYLIVYDNRMLFHYEIYSRLNFETKKAIKKKSMRKKKKPKQKKLIHFDDEIHYGFAFQLTSSHSHWWYVGNHGRANLKSHIIWLTLAKIQFIILFINICHRCSLIENHVKFLYVPFYWMPTT